MTRDEFLKLLPELVKNYQPAPEVSTKISNISLLMVVGPSGVGKTSVINHSGLKYVPSDTTRPPRPGEKDGVDMHFRDNYQQVVDDIKSGRFVQIAPGASGDLYATKESSFPSSGVAVMPVMADVIPIFRGLGFGQTTSVFITPPSFPEWMRRLKEHGIFEQQLAKRLTEAKRSLAFALNDEQMHFILNDKIDEAVTQIKDLLIGQVDHQLEQAAKAAARQILARLEA